MQDNQLTDQLQEQRELVTLLLGELATARRDRKAREADRDAAILPWQLRLSEAAEPFVGEIAVLQAEEEDALAAAVEQVADYDAARKIQLMAGIETPHAARPDGVTIKWLETPTVADASALPVLFQKIAPDMKAIKFALAGGLGVEGVVVERKPSIVVAGDA